MASRASVRTVTLGLAALLWVVFAVLAVPSRALAEPGGQVWASRYNGPADVSDSARALAVSPDGSKVFVTGESNGGPTTKPDYATVSYDASSGAKLWKKRYNGPGDGNDTANAVGVSPDGSKVFVTGQSFGGSGGDLDDDYATVAYDASSGKKLWVRRYDGPGQSIDAAFALTVSPDGSKVFVTGTSMGSTTLTDYATIAYDASSGARLWGRRYVGPGNAFGDAYDEGHALGVSPDGSKVFVTGRSDGPGGLNYATIAYDASSGARLWVSRHDGPGCCSGIATALGVSPDGSKVFVTGSLQGVATGEDYVTVAYDASSGAKLWGKHYDGPASGHDNAFALGVSPDGSSVFVTGVSPRTRNDFDYATLAYDASSGARLWQRRYDGQAKNGRDVATALGVSPDGSTVFVTGGRSLSTPRGHYATIAYDATSGSRLWRSIYDGPGQGNGDLARALGVSPDGSNIFVTGSSTGATSGEDYATVAYGTG